MVSWRCQIQKNYTNLKKKTTLNDDISETTLTKQKNKQTQKPFKKTMAT